MNIFKTFEIFLSEPISMIRKRVIQIMHVDMNIFSKKVPMDFELNENSAQITVYNNEKMYNLLRTVIYKKKLNANAQNSKRKICN